MSGSARFKKRPTAAQGQEGPGSAPTAWSAASMWMPEASAFSWRGLDAGLWCYLNEKHPWPRRPNVGLGVCFFWGNPPRFLLGQ